MNNQNVSATPYPQLHFLSLQKNKNFCLSVLCFLLLHWYFHIFSYFLEKLECKWKNLNENENIFLSISYFETRTRNRKWILKVEREKIKLILNSTPTHPPAPWTVSQLERRQSNAVFAAGQSGCAVSESHNGVDTRRRFNEANKLKNLPFLCQTIVCTFLPRLYRQWTETSAAISFGKPQLTNMLVVARASQNRAWEPNSTKLWQWLAFLLQPSEHNSLRTNFEEDSPFLFCSLGAVHILCQPWERRGRKPKMTIAYDGNWRGGSQKMIIAGEGW